MNEESMKTYSANVNKRDAVMDENTNRYLFLRSGNKGMEEE
jgi:hypothetical protein